MNTAPESTPIVPGNPAIPTVLRVSSGHKRNGKIARLPKAIRDKINQCIDDGRTYPQIIKDLGDDAKDLKPRHFSEWRKGGYEDYLRHQEWRDQLRILRENGSDMSELTDGPKFQETLVQIALTEIFRVLQQSELKPDSLNYIRLFNALARLNREALSLRKYNDQLAKEQTALQQLDINRELVQNEHLAIVDRTDRIMEMPRPRPLWSAPAERSGDGALVDSRPTPGPRDVPARSNPEQSAAQDEASDTVTETPRINNRKSKSKSPSSPLPARACSAETPAPACFTGISPEQEGSVEFSPIENPKSKTENCLDCGSPLPPVPRHSLRRPEDHCPNPNCGMRLPDIGLCYQPGFDHCLNCGATQPALLPGGERPRPNCHKCGERLHNPEPPTT